MIVRILLVSLFAGLSTPAVFGQVPTPIAPPNTISAEATETLRVAPDLARLSFSVVTKDAIAETSFTENEVLTKDLLTNIGKLKVTGLKITSQSYKIAKIESVLNGVPVAPGGNQPMKSDFRTVRTIVIFLKDSDVDQLQANIGAIQKEAAKVGVTGDSLGMTYTGNGYENQNTVRISYGLQNGWDDRSKEVLAKVTKRALERAQLLAEGAGLKVAEVVSITEPTSTTVVNYVNGVVDTSDLVDGELVQKVNVRVTVRVSK
jgi:uncharacterized protein YggE